MTVLDGSTKMFAGVAGSELQIEFNLLGVALIVGNDDHCRGLVLSPDDARKAAAKIEQMAYFAETYGTAANPIPLPGEPARQAVHDAGR
jgi:hypothetical protein